MGYKNPHRVGVVAGLAGHPQTVDVPTALLVLSGAAVGTYVGLRIGGPYGALAGALVGPFVGALAAGMIKRFRVRVGRNGEIDVEYETRYAFG